LPPMVLSVGEREAYERDGYVVRRGVLPPEVIEQIRGVFAAAVDKLAQAWKADGLIEDSHDDADFDHRWALLRAQLPAKYPTAWRRILASPEVYALWQRPELLGVAQDLFGPELVAHSIWNGRPRDSGAQDVQRIDWHQDAHYYKAWDEKDGGLLSTWIPLVPVSAETGCLQICPGSHKLGLIPQIRGANGLRTIDDSVLTDEPVTLDMEPGDVLHFGDLTVHRALDNVTDRVRWSIDIRHGEHTPEIWSKSGRGYICASEDPSKVEDFDTWIARYDYDLHGLSEELGTSYGGLDEDQAAAVLGTSRAELEAY
jgi:phytanoyl-CoA hydroxylase